MLFPYPQLRGDISTLETAPASCPGKTADKVQRRGAIETQTSSTDVALL